MKTPSVKIDLPRHEVFVDGKRKHLSAQEMAVLTALVNAKGRVMSKPDILREAWGYTDSITPLNLRTVGEYVYRVRLKLGKAGIGIETVHRAGYRAAHFMTHFDDPTGNYGGAV